MFIFQNKDAFETLPAALDNGVAMLKKLYHGKQVSSLCLCCTQTFVTFRLCIYTLLI